MNGKWPALALVFSGLLAGAGVWYTQEYGFYTETTDPTGADHPQPVTRIDGTMATMPVTDYRQIDASSSPIRWRACFRMDPAQADILQAYEGATPLIGPGWFDCFDAAAIAADLAAGTARAVLAQSDIRPDVDRVFAVYPDGTAFGWHQYNEKNPARGVMD